ncbi:hypothetical protein XELAEV_18037167mg [Xenopus laevis]|uniref:Uncharacterized protein n=1 Tax=Xenopus laevis TaxID=8355 RepID=A0A974CCW5_XENLA|nr:hypothetical protein XELAEV_18037167mg [Xenopus laevis]
MPNSCCLILKHHLVSTSHICYTHTPTFFFGVEYIARQQVLPRLSTILWLKGITKIIIVKNMIAQEKD